MSKATVWCVLIRPELMSPDKLPRSVPMFLRDDPEGPRHRLDIEKFPGNFLAVCLTLVATRKGFAGTVILFNSVIDVLPRVYPTRRRTDFQTRYDSHIDSRAHDPTLQSSSIGRFCEVQLL